MGSGMLRPRPIPFSRKSVKWFLFKQGNYQTVVMT